MTQSESEAFITTFLREIGDLDEVEIVIVPPFTAIPKVTELLTQTQDIKVGAQNMHWERSGAFTGEISPAMLRELFVRYVVLGHSERRAMFGETDEIVNRKVRAAHEEKLRPILCIGETLAQREKGQVEKVLSSQLRGSLADVDAKELLETVIAYEPVWAIGTGKTATADQAQEAHAFIRQTLREMSDDATAEKIRIQYGGSVKPDNARELLSQPDIDGALVGGASLDPRSFAQIVQACVPNEGSPTDAARGGARLSPLVRNAGRRTYVIAGQGVGFHQASAGGSPGSAHNRGVCTGREVLQHRGFFRIGRRDGAGHDLRLGRVVLPVVVEINLRALAVVKRERGIGQRVGNSGARE